ncbi:MAG: phosphate ABC transporter substrate-binding protein [Erysipelothrix sp.]|nr:phosphate ABC transporter substrate-binding protein [Erysipelothrix sp.]
MNMKKLLIILAAALVLTGCASKNDGFDKTKDITVVSREDGSGTRGAFIELVGVEEKDANGNKQDKTTPEAVIANKTDVVMNNVANDLHAIGYLSLGSLNDTLKGLSIDGVEPTVDNIRSGDYKIARPFNIVVNDDLDELSDDFIKYVLSMEGQKVVEDNGYISVETESKYQPEAISGKIVIAGSSSVSPVMEKLVEAYKVLNPNATIEIQTNDSTAGVQAAVDKTANIGMASRNLKEEELELVKPIVIAIDGIVVVVNKENTMSDISSAQVKDIYVGNIKTWSELIKD